MDALGVLLIWAQVAGKVEGPATIAGGGAESSVAMASLALRRFCSSLTLCSPERMPGLDALGVLLIGLGVLVVLVLLVQGPLLTLRQLIDIPGHVALLRQATARVCRAGRLGSVMIAFTVLSWTGSQALGYLADQSGRGRSDFALLSRSRARYELALEQASFAALTPLRDLAGLGDNLPLLVCAAFLVFRASSGMTPRTLHPAGRTGDPQGNLRFSCREEDHESGSAGRSTLLWGSGGFYVLYRLVARASGSADLPLGGCLVAEALIIPLLMVLCDGFLLAWVLAELRIASMERTREERFSPGQAVELLPAAMFGCALALPARYLASLVFLASQHLPASIGATVVGRYVRWQLGWGLVDFQGAALVVLGFLGAVAWTRGSLRDAARGFRRLLAGEGGHLVVALTLACAAAAFLGGLSYPLLFLLPPAGWVLPAADSYAHYATLPVGLWTAAAVIELAGRSLPLSIPAATDSASQGSTSDLAASTRLFQQSPT